MGRTATWGGVGRDRLAGGGRGGGGTGPRVHRRQSRAHASRQPGLGMELPAPQQAGWQRTLFWRGRSAPDPPSGSLLWAHAPYEWTSPGRSCGNRNNRAHSATAQVQGAACDRRRAQAATHCSRLPRGMAATFLPCQARAGQVIPLDNVQPHCSLLGAQATPVARGPTTLAAPLQLPCQGRAVLLPGRLPTLISFSSTSPLLFLAPQLEMKTATSASCNPSRMPCQLTHQRVCERAMAHTSTQHLDSWYIKRAGCWLPGPTVRTWGLRPPSQQPQPPACGQPSRQPTAHSRPASQPASQSH